MTVWRLRGRVVTPDGVLDDGLVVVQGERLESVAPAAGVVAADMLAPDGWIVPGFIDLQVNGAAGASFSAVGDDLAPVGPTLLRDGVTAYLPTIITSPLAEYPALLDAAERLPNVPGLPEPLGVHLEGPYLNPARRGMHRAACMRRPDVAEFERGLARPAVRVVTLAPELPGAPALVRRLAERGMIVSAGHSAAAYAEAAAGFDAGIRWVTHLFNAMPPLLHREPGLVGAALTDPRVTVGLIADGVHVHPVALQTALRARGLDAVTVVSDASPLLGVPDGRYPSPEGWITVAGATARLDEGTLAGSVVPLLGALRLLVRQVGLSVPEVVRLVTENPARLLGLTGRKGRLAAGLDADLVVLGPALDVRLVLARGRSTKVGPS